MGIGLRRSGRTGLLAFLCVLLYVLVFLSSRNPIPRAAPKPLDGSRKVLPSRVVFLSSGSHDRVGGGPPRPPEKPGILLPNANRKPGKDSRGEVSKPVETLQSPRVASPPSTRDRPPSLQSHRAQLGLDLIEPATLPSNWTAPPDLLQRLESRRQRVREVCRREGLDIPREKYQANAWEFLINREHGLVWCNVFKAASSSWLWNFNLLAGYSEKDLLTSGTAPVELARRKYPRPTVEQLQATLEQSPPPLSFMITRHPLLRLVSGYRNKILPGNSMYIRSFKRIYHRYKHLGPPVPRAAKNGKNPPKGSTSPSFRQFVQFVLDEEARGQPLDMHWIPQARFCTPCLVNFTVFAKTETLQEDANYVIFSSGIDKVIKPKIINRSTGVSTDAMGHQLLCQLLPSQMDDLLQLYQLDLLLFDYEADSFRNCTGL